MRARAPGAMARTASRYFMINAAVATEAYDSAEFRDSTNYMVHEGWLEELPLIREYYATFGDKLPKELSAMVDRLEAALKS